MGVDRTPVGNAGHRVGIGKPEQGLTAIVGLTLANLCFDSAYEDAGALPIEAPVHIGGEAEACEIEGAERDLIIDVLVQEAQRHEKDHEDDAGRKQRERKVEGENRFAPIMKIAPKTI